ncbi:MAG TPA: hypothetical protein VJ804_08885, partial [Acidimicrobiales bacterium]|nr:hypothetical protein [Acidimicrobiales bacterium]
MDEQNTETPADAPRADADAAADAPTEPVAATEPVATTEEEAADGADAPDVEPKPATRRRWLLPVSLLPVVLLVVLVIAWAIDTSSGGVARNVSLAGTDVSGASEAELASTVEDLAAAWVDVPVELVVTPGRADDGTETTEPDVYTTTAGEIGLMVDQDRTVEAALDVGDDAFLLFRPFEWAGSFLAERDAPV